MLKEIHDKEAEDDLFDIWKLSYPLMACGMIEFTNFNDFKDRVWQKDLQYTPKTSEEIEREIKEVFGLET